MNSNISPTVEIKEYKKLCKIIMNYDCRKYKYVEKRDN
jgi:hypothetical protein